MSSYRGSAKPFKGLGMEGWVARWYTRTRRNDTEDFRSEARAVAAHLPVLRAPASLPSNWRGWEISRLPVWTSAGL
jgi:hypothetical protein